MGANPSKQDIEDNTPLHIAAMYDSYEAAECLMKFNPNLFIRNKEGKFAVDIVSSSKMIRLFNNVVKTTHDKASSARKPPPNYDITKDVRVALHTASNKFINISSSKEQMVTKSNEGKDKMNQLRIMSLIGKGSFGEVYLVQHKVTKILFAMKVLSKLKIFTQNLFKYAFVERNVMSTIRHAFIVPLRMAFQTSDRLFMVMDYCQGGDLGKVLRREKKFAEPRAKLYICEILLALEHLHKNDIIYRDLKPDNVVLDATGHALLTDFGLSKEGMEDGTIAQSFCGSVAYLAPEMLERKGHSKVVDWYLLGVLLYEMLVGVPPFYDTSREKLFSNILYASLKCPMFISDKAQSFIYKLLEKDPTKRLGANGDSDELKAHPFLKDVNWDDMVNRYITE
jgi:serine/threonine protein kinase